MPWELQHQGPSTKEWIKLPSVEYPEWVLEKLSVIPVKQFQGMARLSFQSSSNKVSKLRVVQLAQELE